MRPGMVVCEVLAFPVSLSLLAAFPSVSCYENTYQKTLQGETEKLLKISTMVSCLTWYYPLSSLNLYLCVVTEHWRPNSPGLESLESMRAASLA